MFDHVHNITSRGHPTDRKQIGIRIPLARSDLAASTVWNTGPPGNTGLLLKARDLHGCSPPLTWVLNRCVEPVVRGNLRTAEWRHPPNDAFFRGWSPPIRLDPEEDRWDPRRKVDRRSLRARPRGSTYANNPHGRDAPDRAGPGRSMAQRINSPPGVKCVRYNGWRCVSLQNNNCAHDERSFLPAVFVAGLLLLPQVRWQ